MVYTIRRSLFAILYLAAAAFPVAAQSANEGVIEGTVESAGGPEAGVWVIAETDDTPTHFVKIVV
ncbi:MAG: hypothetical protein F4X09_03425, partial [Gammaproteobacteria bacterium]|nr:hypothetical protein [Gammaproteobacteria bacterium]